MKSGGERQNHTMRHEGRKLTRGSRKLEREESRKQEKRFTVEENRDGDEREHQ